VWEWVDVCCYALIPFTVMSIGTFLIVYRVYYQQRRVFRSRRSGQTNHSGSVAPNKAKSLFYLLFTLNLLYFVLVSPVVFATSILFRDPTAEVSYPRFKAIIYLMQYCNHSLNFIFYGERTQHTRRHRLGHESNIVLSRHHVATVSTDSLQLVRCDTFTFASLLSTNGNIIRTTVENAADTDRTFANDAAETDSRHHGKQSCSTQLERIERNRLSIDRMKSRCLVCLFVCLFVFVCRRCFFSLLFANE
jgi:hypothetical protein